MEYPNLYAENNIIGSINILNSMIKHNCYNIIFSSSAAVYGYPKYLPIDEKHPKNPINFYGYTKLAVEQILDWYSKTKGLKYASLRYFNAAGYDMKNRVKNREKNPANLLPIIMEVASGERKELQVFGNDYKTNDGTCIRDYIHVNDLSDAHIKCIDYIFETRNNLILNLATGLGYSIIDVINETENIVKKDIRYKITDRRLGDPDELISTSRYAKKLINWEPRYSSLNQILKSMWNVYKKI